MGFGLKEGKKQTMIIVAQIANNILGQTDECDSYEEALDLAKKIIGENGVEITDEVIEALESGGFVAGEETDTTWSVCIGQTE